MTEEGRVRLPRPNDQYQEVSFLKPDTTCNLADARRQSLFISNDALRKENSHPRAINMPGKHIEDINITDTEAILDDPRRAVGIQQGCILSYLHQAAQERHWA
jgi:hypothetical protein